MSLSSIYLCIYQLLETDDNDIYNEHIDIFNHVVYKIGKIENFLLVSSKVNT